jgi:phage recombination protein Bet
MTALTKQQPQELIGSKWNMTREQIELVKRTFAAGTTDDEFALFMTTAHRLGLDVFSKQIYAIKRPTWDQQARQMVDKLTIQVGIDGFRAVAERTGQLDGHDGPYWCGPDGAWKDVWLDKEPPCAAKVLVYRKGSSRPFAGVATYDSYAQTNKDGKANRTWSQMPDVMLAKCAEALALRKAFPSQLSGVYAPEEMGQAYNESPRRDVPALAPAAEPTADTEHDLHIADLLASVREAGSMAELDELVPSLGKLTGPARNKAREEYRARLAWLEKHDAGGAA